MRRLELTGAQLGPLAYTHFCVRYPAECRLQGVAFGDAADIAWSPRVMATLSRVNATVNSAIVPAAHTGPRGYDSWRIGPSLGDCNDFAVSKRHALLALDWPSRALLLAEVITTWGEHHLVLVVRTTAGDYVLDNLRSDIRLWNATPYRWVRAQMPSEPSLWAAVRQPERRLASAQAGRALASGVRSSSPALD